MFVATPEAYQRRLWRPAPVAVQRAHLRSCRPAFGFLARVVRAHVFDIVICEIARLERHCNPVHSGGGAFLRAKTSWCCDAGGSRRHEGATIERCHMKSPRRPSQRCTTSWATGYPTLVSMPNYVNRDASASSSVP